MKRYFLVAALLLLAIGRAQGADARPNIIVILCDDLGYADVGFNGSPDIKTPELDRLAHSGTIFRSAYVAHPFCGPSRMGLMTGRYPHLIGTPFNLPHGDAGAEEKFGHLGVPVGEKLISSELQDAGYYTGCVGKWHLGIEPDYHPNKRGFDEFYGFLGGGHAYFPEAFKAKYERRVKAGDKHIDEYLLPLERNGVEVDETEYITDGLSREAVRFVDGAAKRDQPFFLYLAYNAPHSPLEAKEEDMALYPNIADKKRRTYAGMVHAVDRGVGKLVEALKLNGEYENTLIVFLSDNGGKLELGGNNAPLRDGKGSTAEGGFRVPLFFHWPKGVPAGRLFDHPVSSLDFYPTFAGLAGASLPTEKELDGKDILASIQSGGNPRKGEMIYAVRHRGPYSDAGARQDQWKLLRIGQGPWRLYDIDKDIGESRDLSAQHPELLKELISKARRWSDSHIEPLWFYNLDEEAAWGGSVKRRYERTFGD